MKKISSKLSLMLYENLQSGIIDYKIVPV